jgi:hypothetical protein
MKPFLTARSTADCLAARCLLPFWPQGVQAPKKPSRLASHPTPATCSRWRVRNCPPTSCIITFMTRW